MFNYADLRPWRHVLAYKTSHDFFCTNFSREYEKTIEFADGNNNYPLVRFDPAVNRALTYAIGYGLIEQQPSAKYKLTHRGKQLADHIKTVGDLMTVEIDDLNLLAKKLTETKVEEVIEQWRIKDVENQ